MPQLTLHFVRRAGKVELEKTIFQISSGEQFTAVRGKTGDAYGFDGSFQWTPAVRAVCVFFLQALCRHRANGAKRAATLAGERGSLASSLDYAINKEPQWLCDMFGLDASGKTNLRRLIYRSNTNVKHPGPVSITLNETALPTENIHVLVDSMAVHDHEALDRILSALTTDPYTLTTTTSSLKGQTALILLEPVASMSDFSPAV